MSILNKIFRSNMVDCPRCLGKGNVDLEDIKRLKKELFWAPGKCAYCNGIGKVPADRIEKINTDLEYLTVDLSSHERHKIINGDAGAIKRANEFKILIENFIKNIEHLYYIENKEPDEIADEIFYINGEKNYSVSQKQELIDYVKKVIKSKL